VRTMTRGLKTLWCMSEFLNPVRYGVFAWMLFSHKLCRWMVPWALVVALAAMGALAPGAAWARAGLVLIGGLAGLGGLGWRWLGGTRILRALALPAYVMAGNLAALHAWWLALSGAQTAVWEPTRRGLEDTA